MEQPYGASVEKITSACGMQLVHGLDRSLTVYDQIRTLDYAFNYWGDGKWAYGSVGQKDRKSQIIFTDTIDQEKTRWEKIKAISTRGPVTWNERYKKDDHHRKEVAVYILTRKDYYTWRDKFLKENPWPKKQEEKKEEIKKAPAPTPETQAAEAEMLQSFEGPRSVRQGFWRDFLNR